MAHQIVEWEKERIFRERLEWEWKSSVSLHIEAMFSISGFEGLRKQRERERFSLLGTGTRRGDTEEHTHTPTHTHLIYLYQLTPVLIFQLYPFTTSSLLHFTSHSLNCFVLFTDIFFSLIHVLHKISQTVSGSIRNVLLFVWLVNTEYGTLCMRFRVSLSLRGEIRFVKNDWVTGERRGASQVHYRLAEWSTPGHDGWR